MSYKRKLLTIGSTVMLTAGLVTLTQLDAQQVEAREEVEGTQPILTATKDNHSEMTSEEEKAPQTTPDTTEKDDSVEKENKGDVTKSSTDRDSEPEKPVTPTNKTGWDGDSYYINGEKVTSKWIYDKDYNNDFYVDENGHYKHDTWEGGYWLNTNGEVAKNQWIYDKDYENWFKVDANGHYKHDLWEGGYWLNTNGEVAKSQWIYDKAYENWFKVDENGHYKHDAWEGGYWLNTNGEVAKNQWIYDKAYENWFKVDENGHYKHDTWEGGYYLNGNGEVAKSQWIHDKAYENWFKVDDNGHYLHDIWVGEYYLESNGEMAHNEWIWDKDYNNWFFINEDGSYARYTWKGSYFLTKWGEMAKSRWAYSPETGWHYFNPDGTYVQNRWVGAYYIKQWGYMASDEWVWDPNYSNWFYIAEDGHYVRNAWIGNYYLTKWGEMAKDKVEEEFSNWIYTANHRYFYDNKGHKIGNSTAKKVIDVSEWQGEIDWESVMKHNDIDAVIVRIGYGSIGIDKHAKETIKQLNELNIPYGIYLYSYASNAEDGKAEAEHTVKLLEEFDAKPTYPIYFDVEDWVRGEKRAPTDTQTWLEIINAFIDTMTEAGVKNVDVYSYRSLLQTRLNHPDILKHVTWVAAYTDELGWENPYYDGPLGWQYTSSAKMPDLGDELGHTDVSVWYE